MLFSPQILVRNPHGPPSGGGGGPFTFISGISTAKTGAGGGGAGGETTGTIDTTGAGLLILVTSYFSGATGVTISDSKGNSWTPLTVVTSANSICNVYYSVPTSVGSGHTATIAGTNIFGTLVFSSFAFGAASPADQQSQNTGTGTSAAGSSITPSVGGELVITGIASPADSVAISSVNGGFTIIDDTIPGLSGEYIGGGAAYLIQTSAAAAAPTWTLGSSAEWAVKMASFKVS